jgi:hypothetical protein
MLYCHWPKLRIGDVGPVNCGVEHHGSGDRHDRANGSLGMPILVVRSSSSKSYMLAEILKVELKCV